MTAEIVIMNREAIAVASDSAVTSVGKGARKIFTSANKLFALSKYHPVGIMVHGNATIVDAPWELVIKAYRNQIGMKEFTSLEEYANDFIAFLDNGNPLFPVSIQERYFKGAVEAYFGMMKDEIKRRIQSMIDSSGSIDEEGVSQAISQVIEVHADKFRKAERAPSTPRNHSQTIIERLGKTIDEALVGVFEKLPVSKRSMNRLRRMAADIASKFPAGMKFGGASGVVITGFGKDDYFPVLKSFLIEMVVCDKLKYKVDRERKVSPENRASIIPFAQQEVVATFMEGIDPFLRRTEESYLAEVFKKCLERVAGEVVGLDNSQKTNLIDRLAIITKEEIENHRKKLDTFRRTNYVDPVMSVVSMLPKDELAAMAETFVNLTSFKRKVSMQPETVGGPIDVAVISKGDGFVWIKRKHYFEPSLNPQFFANYYREVENEAKQEE